MTSKGESYLREINKLIIHNSDSDHKYHDNVESIYNWHVKENGWSDIGYHFLITQNGSLHDCRPLQKKGAHCKGHNDDSIGICLTGKNSFSPEQFETLRAIIATLVERYNIKEVKGHRDYDSSKTCPDFDVQSLLKSVFSPEHLKEQ